MIEWYESAARSQISLSSFSAGGKRCREVVVVAQSFLVPCARVHSFLPAHTRANTYTIVMCMYIYHHSNEKKLASSDAVILDF